MNRNAISRRRFLKRAGAASAALAAAPVIIPASALGNAQRPAPSERVTVASIGVGGQGSGLLSNFLNISEAQCVAVCDPFQSRREERAAQVDAHTISLGRWDKDPSCAAVRDFRELLDRPDIDAVVIATPDHWHVPIAMAAARAGKDMYVEKPLGLSLAQNSALRDEIRRCGVVFQYGTQQRSSRNFRFACELVINQRIGQVKEVHAWCEGSEAGGSTRVEDPPEGFDYDLWLGPAPVRPYTHDRCVGLGRWFISDYAIGFIAGWGAHPLDIAQWGLGRDRTSPVEYTGQGTYPTEGLYDTATSWDVTCRYADGLPMRFMSADVARPVVEAYRPFMDHGTTFIGSEGWVSVDRAGIHAEPASLLTSVIRPNEVRLPESVNHQQNFIESVRQRTQPISPIEAALHSDAISHLSDIAISLKRTIRWDPERETIVDDPQAIRRMTCAIRPPWRI